LAAIGVLFLSINWRKDRANARGRFAAPVSGCHSMIATGIYGLCDAFAGARTVAEPASEVATISNALNYL